MKERPILFSAEMVRAILDGRKTQTRRAIKMPRTRDAFTLLDRGDGWWPYQSDDGESALCSDGNEHPYACPYGKPGDRLWVREAHAFVPEPAYRCSTGIYQQINPADDYQACVYRENFDRARGFSWRPSIHMPRWASRILLEVTDVRVERLQEISDEDALAEGVYPTRTGLYAGAAKSEYRNVWEQINGAGSWNANPWVWCVTFRVIQPSEVAE